MAWGAGRAGFQKWPLESRSVEGCCDSCWNTGWVGSQSRQRCRRKGLKGSLWVCERSEMPDPPTRTAPKSTSPVMRFQIKPETFRGGGDFCSSHSQMRPSFFHLPNKRTRGAGAGYHFGCGAHPAILEEPVLATPIWHLGIRGVGRHLDHLKDVETQPGFDHRLVSPASRVKAASSKAASSARYPFGNHPKSPPINGSNS
jgi:hypothetical protein